MVRTLHAAGIEVILDVVYNHTVEGEGGLGRGKWWISGARSWEGADRPVASGYVGWQAVFL